MLKNISKTIIMGAVFCSIPALSQAHRVHLDNVHIVNKTNYVIQGEVDYTEIPRVHISLCSNDSYLTGRNGSWTASSRGFCLVSKITVKFIDANGDLKVGVPFTSLASYASEFEVVKTADGNVKVEKK